MLFRYTPRRLQLFGFGPKPEEFHRESRSERLFHGIKLLSFTVGIIGASSVVFGCVDSIYNHLFPSHKSLRAQRVTEERLSGNPALALAILKATLNQPFLLPRGAVQPPFGAPMLIPDSVSESDLSAIRALHDEVAALTANGDSLASPDIWALLASKSLQLLGGPVVDPRSGRRPASEDPLDEGILVVPPAVRDKDRSIQGTIETLESRGFTLMEIVALIGGKQGVGFHSGANIVLVNDSFVELGAGDSNAPPSLQRTCTTMPLVLSNGYFRNLLNNTWEPFLTRSRWQARSDSGYFVCKDEKRAPWRVKYVQSKTSRIVSQSRLSRMSREEQEQHLRSQAEQQQEEAALSKVCNFISMQGIDVALLDNQHTVAATLLFADDELKFFESLATACAKILAAGYDAREFEPGLL